MNSIVEIIEDIRSGKMVILVDDENRENEGDLILAADFVTPQAINFMATEARGLICLSLAQEQISRLGLPLMVRDERNYSPNKTAFTVSIEAASGVSTGISASDRAHTIRVAANPLAKASDVITPGHVFPIAAQPGGVLKRAGHTEASVDLARLAGLNSAAVICEIMNADGTMARVDELKQFAHKHQIKIGTIEDLIKYRLENESFVEEVKSQTISTTYGGMMTAKVFKNTLNGREHLALIKGDISGDTPVVVRVQNESILNDVFDLTTDASMSTDTSGVGMGSSNLGAASRSALPTALSLISELGRGVFLYLRTQDLSAQVHGQVNMDERDYGVGAQILRTLGLKDIILISNHAAKRVGLRAYGIEIVDNLMLSEQQKENSNVTEIRN